MFTNAHLYEFVIHDWDVEPLSKKFEYLGFYFHGSIQKINFHRFGAL